MGLLARLLKMMSSEVGVDGECDGIEEAEGNGRREQGDGLEGEM